MLRFIDLFAGLGGFHKALHQLGHECVFASEINENLRNVYERNWNIRPEGDIKKLIENDIDAIPEHDILCGGFPCQPFSKAGKQEGMNDANRGTLFDDIVRILDVKRPKYFILENVPFIAKHDNEDTWRYMESEFERLGYHVDHKNYSPHDFGIPQHRLRIFIVGSLDGLEHFSFDAIDRHKKDDINIQSYIDELPRVTRELPSVNKEILAVWQDFVQSVPKETKLPGHPLWTMEFGATYPFEETIPHRMKISELGEYHGNFGQSLKGMSKKEQFENLPSYARTTRKFPDWKVRYIKYNREFYTQNKHAIESVVKRIANLPNQSWQKLEWNVGNLERDIYNYILQFRPSGIRVKKPDFFPSLVCTSTQVPIIGWKQRYITREEGLRLQSLEGIELPEFDNAAFKALGNAVNAHIVGLIADQLLSVEKIKLLSSNIIEHERA